jgi:hypothetical protein
MWRILLEMKAKSKISTYRSLTAVLTTSLQTNAEVYNLDAYEQNGHAIIRTHKTLGKLLRACIYNQQNECIKIREFTNSGPFILGGDVLQIPI